MSAAKFTIVVTGNDDEIPVDSTPESLQRLNNYVTSALSGSRLGAVAFQVRNNAVTASGTVTCAAVSAADTVTFAGVTFTAVTGAAGANQFDRSGTDTATATSLASAINNTSTVGASQCFLATAALGVVTITAAVPGHIGNAVTLASSNGTRLAVSGARLTGGTNDTLITHTV